VCLFSVAAWGEEREKFWRLAALMLIGVLLSVQALELHEFVTL